MPQIIIGVSEKLQKVGKNLTIYYFDYLQKNIPGINIFIAPVCVIHTLLRQIQQSKWHVTLVVYFAISSTCNVHYTHAVQHYTLVLLFNKIVYGASLFKSIRYFYNTDEPNITHPNANLQNFVHYAHSICKHYILVYIISFICISDAPFYYYDYGSI